MKLFNRRTIVLLIGLILSLALYFFTEARYAALLIAVILLVLICGAIIANISGANMELSIEGPMEGHRNQATPVSVKVRNRGRMPVFLCKVNTSMENLLTGEVDKSIQSLSVGGNKEADASFGVLEKGCGCIRVKADDMRVSDPLGIFNVKPGKVTMPEGDSCSICFMPAAAETEMSDDQIYGYDMESYKYSPLKSGSDPSETFDIREYQLNDSAKAIHWKLSSKSDRLLIREFGLPVENRVMIIADKNMAEPTPDKAEMATDYTSSLSFTLLKRGISHTIGWYDYLNDEFRSFRVDGEDAFWLAIREMISCPFRNGQVSSADHFIESGLNRDFSSYIYVSESGSDIERLMNYGTVTVLRPENIK